MILLNIKTHKKSKGIIKGGEIAKNPNSPEDTQETM